MTVADCLLGLVVLVGLAHSCDHVWLTYIRPWLAKKRGWAEVNAGERIPLAAWAGSVAFVGIVFVILPFVGFVAGY